MSEFASFEGNLGYFFKDPSLLRLALTHPSVAHDQLLNVQHNQRLEFLGDSVLQLVLTGELYQRFTGFGEGPLTKARAQLVNRKTLADQASKLEIGRHLIMSRGEEMSGGRLRPSGLADAFEAVLGGVYLDSDFSTVRGVILHLFRDIFGELQVIPSLQNPKGELQELLQATATEAPQYRLDSATGPDHDREFVCTVVHENRALGSGRGKSKKEAESAAAVEALLQLQKPLVEAPLESNQK